MKITIKSTGEENKIEFSNEGLNDKYVEISINGEKGAYLIEDIMPALIAFDAKNSRQKLDSNY